ncbi:MAG TPA: exonuclease domain-containing protein [Polyangia bacterium]
MDIEARLLAGWRPRAFVALDFETANRSSSSACAVALVRVEGDRIVGRVVDLIRPPTQHFEFTDIHGITSADVADRSTFGEVWKTLLPVVQGSQFLAAHNAAFDRDVLESCCRNARISVPDVPFVCTVALARLKWKLHPTKLPDVCAFLGLIRLCPFFDPGAVAAAIDGLPDTLAADDSTWALVYDFEGKPAWL